LGAERVTETTLAIAAPSFNAPSETFIRAHARTLAPGATILLCDDGTDAEVFNAPVLTALDPYPSPRSLAERVNNGLRFRWHHRVDPALRGVSEQRVRAFLDAYRPRALLAEYGTTGCRLRVACQRASVPLFVHFHGFDATVLPRRQFWRRHYNRLFKDSAGVIVGSNFLATRLHALGCPIEKLHVCPYGVDPERFPATTRQSGRVVAIGRLVEKKAPHLTIDAFAQVRHTVPDAELDIIGDGPLRGRCQDAVERRDLVGAVRLHGVQPPAFIADLLSRASVFAQHSVTAATGDTESYGVSLMEAQAAKVPVVATDHNGFRDTVANGETGILVPEHDVDGMAEAMIALLRDPDRAAAMGRAGRERVLAHFTHDHTARRLRAIMGLDDPAGPPSTLEEPAA